MAEQFHAPTADDLASRGYRPAGGCLVRKAGKTVRAQLFGNPETLHTVLVICEPVAGKTACRGHWKFNPLASWWRWHFKGGKR